MQRVAVLKAVWGLERLASPAKRAARATAGARAGGARPAGPQPAAAAPQAARKGRPAGRRRPSLFG